MRPPPQMAGFEMGGDGGLPGMGGFGGGGGGGWSGAFQDAPFQVCLHTHAHPHAHTSTCVSIHVRMYMFMCHTPFQNSLYMQAVDPTQ